MTIFPYFNVQQINGARGFKAWATGVLALAILGMSLFCGGGGGGGATAAAPVITTHPASMTGTVGFPATFTVVATGDAPLTYQWTKDGAPVASAKLASLTLPATQPQDAGAYRVTVSNAQGSVTSNPATLLLEANPGKAPEVLPQSPVITSPSEVKVVYVGDPVSFSVVASGPGPFTYQWSKDGSMNVVGNASVFTIASAQLADAGAYTVTVSNAGGSATSQVASRLFVASAPVAPAITVDPASQSVTKDDAVTFAVTATGTAPLTYQWLKDGTALGGTSTSPSYVIGAAQLADAGLYSVMVANTAGSATSNPGQLSVSLAAVAPSISTQPASQTVTEGELTTFTVTATGSTTLHYQWQHDGIQVGSDSASLILPFPVTTDAGSYTVTVTNGAGSMASTPAVLTVNPVAVTLAGGLSLDLQPIPAGTFLMGAASRQVTLSRNFFMGTYTVSQAQWQAVMGNNPSRFTKSGGGDAAADVPNRPVEQVSWNDICVTASPASPCFLDQLNAATTTMRPAGLVFRLPTEAEWEYACRAGTTTTCYWGNDPAQTQVLAYAWCAENTNRYSGPTHPAGQKLPNDWGLFDMNGNVWEWCQDWAFPVFGANGGTVPQADPTGPVSGSAKVLRGGAWNSPSSLCNSVQKSGWPATGDGSDIGFRVVLAPPSVP